MANYSPIWKDKSISVQSGAFFIYKLEDDGAEILVYSGKANMLPDAGPTPVQRTAVYINSIIADYLDIPELPDFTYISSAQFVEASFLTSFKCYDGATVRFNGAFIADWSYDYNYDYETQWKGISFPVNGRVSRGQYFVYSVIEASVVVVSFKYKDGHTDAVSLVGTGKDFNADFNADFLVADAQAEPAKSGFVILDMSSYDDVISVGVRIIQPDGTELTEEFEVADTCSRYVLYYRNAYGGWDSFLLEGLCSETADLTRHTAKRSYTNTSSFNRGTFNFCNEIVRQWTLRTGYMNDSQSLRMHHLLNSPDVCLYDMETGLLMTVVLTDTQAEYKTYRGNSRKMINYELTAQLAQDIQRR